MQLVEINLHTHAIIVCLFEQIFFTRKIVHNIHARLLRESQMYLEYTFQSQIFLIFCFVYFFKNSKTRETDTIFST